ncbi:carotenoid biosynthesis protein [Acidianus sulfidivorans JP7]|uniref:Carotenoid biosynthesis protein n=1 Tax=Acidianus sulfidivorans JP7 TaxID=619593 RepID=A0A2U9IPW6_9CREN|nr:carotenoid biosynthesis protein [Acidianus sulfidivorans]AWR98061.1 carotenoid biosynthesis protein [Acidianus sulfidivorans JP7]
MDRIYLISFILLAIGIILDGLLALFFIAAIISLILLSKRRKDFPIVFLVGAIIGFIFEKIGITTGIPFGHYAYHFPPYILGVPIFVIFGWGIFSFLSYLTIFNLPSRIKLIIFPFLMVIIDLSVDPIMVSAGFWTWEKSAINYFGIPITNFVGWYIVSLIIIATILVVNNRGLVEVGRIRGRENNSSSSNNIITTYFFPLAYYLFSLNFFIHAKPQLEKPLMIGMLFSLIITLIVVLLNRRVLRLSSKK